LRTEHCTLRHPLPLSQQYPLPSAIPFDWVLRAFPLDEQHKADLDENQSNLTIPSSPRSTIRTSRCRVDASFPNLALGKKGVFVVGTIPLALDPCGFGLLGLGRGVVLEIRKSITEDGSSALATGISCRLCSRGLASGARRHREKPFLALLVRRSGPQLLNQRINDDWVFSDYGLTRIRASVAQDPAKGLCVKKLEIPFAFGHVA
jgi:hypothetical protein